MSNVPTTAEVPAASLVGSLAHFPLADVLTLLAGNDHLGEVQVMGTGVSGRLWVDSSRVTGWDVANAQTATKAVFELALLDSGWFSFYAGATPPAAQIGQPIDEVLATIGPQLSEWHELLEAVPLHGMVQLAPTPPSNEVQIQAAEWKVLSAAGAATMSVADFVAALDEDQVMTLRLLRRMSSAGLLTIDGRFVGGAASATLPPPAPVEALQIEPPASTPSTTAGEAPEPGEPPTPGLDGAPQPAWVAPATEDIATEAPPSPSPFSEQPDAAPAPAAEQPTAIWEAALAEQAASWETQVAEHPGVDDVAAGLSAQAASQVDPGLAAGPVSVNGDSAQSWSAPPTPAADTVEAQRPTPVAEAPGGSPSADLHDLLTAQPETPPAPTPGPFSAFAATTDVRGPFSDPPQPTDAAVAGPFVASPQPAAQGPFAPTNEAHGGGTVQYRSPAETAAPYGADASPAPPPPPAHPAAGFGDPLAAAAPTAPSGLVDPYAPAPPAPYPEPAAPGAAPYPGYQASPGATPYPGYEAAAPGVDGQYPPPQPPH